jgi:hypothetical protein
MPAQYAYDLSWWLILRNPAVMISDRKEEFLDLFEPRKEQFISAMERAEDALHLPVVEPRLSSLIGTRGIAGVSGSTLQRGAALTSTKSTGNVYIKRVEAMRCWTRQCSLGRASS